MEKEFNLGDDELSEDLKSKLRDILKDFFERPLEKASNFDWESFKKNETFKAVMMPSKLFWVISNFERSFTQKLGSKIFEKFAREIAKTSENMGFAYNSHTIKGLTITSQEARKIDRILSDLEDRNREPNWEREKQEILNVTDEGQLNALGNITWDLWVEDFSNGRALGAELKTPKPNKDQTIAAKRKMLSTVAAFKHEDDEIPMVRFVFPFNPFGEARNYEWWPPRSIFNVRESDGMMIAEDFWDSLGGEGTMQRLGKFLREESTGNLKKLKRLAGDDDSLDLSDFI